MRRALVVLLLLFSWVARAAEDDEAQLLVSEARKAMARKDYDHAAEALDRALAADPRRIDAYLLRASVHTVKKQYDAGVTLLRRAQALAPENLEVQAALGSELTLRGEPGDVEAGVALLDGVVQRDPASYQAHATLARQHAARGEHRQAAASLRAYLASRPPALAPEDPAFELLLAEAELRSGEPERARERFVKLLKADGKNTRARLGAAWAAAAIDCRAALPELEGLGRLAEKHPEVWLVTGRCKLAVGKNAEAKDYAERYLAQRPDAAGHALRGEAILAGGNPYEARKELAEAVRLEPKDRRHLVRWARATRMAGNAAEAAARLEAAAAEPGDEGDLELIVELAEMRLALGKPAEARAILEPQLAAHGDDAGLRGALGAALLAEDNPEAALPHLEAAAAKQPRSRAQLVEALVRLGTQKLVAGDAAAAKAPLARAVELDGNHQGALVALGAALLSLDDAAGAVALLERAARGGKDPLALQLYGRALAETGKASQAVLVLESALPLVASDAARTADLTVELAAAEVDSGEPARAVARLESALAKASSSSRDRLEDAYVPAARSAAARAMAGGAYATAQRLLERAEKILGRDGGATLTAVRCELALAATGAGDREAATSRLKQLADARCPFAPPADELAVPMLAAANVRPDDHRVDASLAKLSSLAQRSQGASAQLAAELTRWLALRAAAAAHAKGRADKARRYLNLAVKAPGPTSREVSYALAVLELEGGDPDLALRSLERLTDDIPEAYLAMGLAYEKKGDAGRALDNLQKALARGVRAPGLAEWIEVKQRIHGGTQ